VGRTASPFLSIEHTRRCSRIVQLHLFISFQWRIFLLPQLHVDQIVDSFTDFVYKIWEVDTKFVRNALIGHYPQPPNAFPSLLTCAMVSPISNVSSTFTIRIQISRLRLRLNHRQERPTKLREMRNRKPDIRIVIKRRQCLLAHPPPPARSTRHPQHPPDERSPNRAPIEVPAQTASGGLAESRADTMDDPFWPHCPSKKADNLNRGVGRRQALLPVW